MTIMTTLLQSLAPRRHASDLQPGDRINQPGIDTGTVERVWRDPDFRDGCVTVELREGRILILPEARRVGVWR